MCNEPYRPLWPPDVKAELQTLCLGEVDHFDAFSVELMDFWMRRSFAQ